MATSGVLFVTSFFRHHGVAFFDIILHAHAERSSIAKTGKTEGKLDQHQLRRRRQHRLPRGVDGAVFLVPKAGGDRRKRWVSTRPTLLREGSPKWPLLQKSIRDDREQHPEADQVEAWLKAALASDQLSLRAALDCKPKDVSAEALWQIMNELPLPDQIAWWREYSPWRNAKGVEIVEIGDEGIDPDDPAAWTRALHHWINEQPPGTRYLVNLAGTDSKNHLGWNYLAWRFPRLQNSMFCAFRTLSTSEDPRRFRPIRVQKLPRDLFEEFGKLSTPQTFVRSPERDRVERQLKAFKRYNDLFAIVLLGERGTGKSSTIRSVFNDQQQPFYEKNCASLKDVTMAHSHLFGHVKNAFSGATFPRDGLFKLANNGVLFLDEVHTLTPEIQQLLLTALQTDDEGWYRFTPLGTSKEERSKFQLVLGSNLPEVELWAELLHDFRDRIFQRKLTMPPFDKTTELESGWAAVWARMNLRGAHDPLQDESVKKRFKCWLGSLDYSGNFRDLERLAIRLADLQRAPDLLDSQEGDEDPIWFAVLRREWAREEELRKDALARRTADPKSPVAPVRPEFTDEYRRLFDVDFNASDISVKALVEEYRRHVCQRLVEQSPTQGAAAARAGVAPNTFRKWLRPSLPE